MAQTEWEKLSSGAIGETFISQGITTNAALIGNLGPGGNSKVYGIHVKEAVQGFAGRIVNLVNYNPIVGGYGAWIYCAMRKYTSQPGYAPMIFMVNGKNAQSAEGYMLGLTEDRPYRIALKRGRLAEGLRSTDTNLLGLSVDSWLDDRWFFLMLKAFFAQQGDVKIEVEADTSSTIDPSSPGLFAVDGIDDYYDDCLGILSGTVPPVGDQYVGYGTYNRNVAGSLSLFDYYIVSRQTGY